MNRRKTFLAPFWCMLLILIFQAMLAVDYIMKWYHLYSIEMEVEGAANDYTFAALRADFWFRFDMFVLIVILAETILYYRWRKRITNNAPALVHVGCLFLNFLVWPAISMLSMNEAEALPDIPISEMREAIAIEICLVTIAHIAFVYLWTRGLAKPATAASSQKQPAQSADGDWVEELHDLVD